jgi:hypothetical protein
MDRIEKAKRMFFELESQAVSKGNIALRNFEIQSRLAQFKK